MLFFVLRYLKYGLKSVVSDLWNIEYDKNKLLFWRVWFWMNVNDFNLVYFGGIELDFIRNIFFCWKGIEFIWDKLFIIFIEKD